MTPSPRAPWLAILALFAGPAVDRTVPFGNITDAVMETSVGIPSSNGNASGVEVKKTTTIAVERSRVVKSKYHLEDQYLTDPLFAPLQPYHSKTELLTAERCGASNVFFCERNCAAMDSLTGIDGITSSEGIPLPVTKDK